MFKKSHNVAKLTLYDKKKNTFLQEKAVKLQHPQTLTEETTKMFLFHFLKNCNIKLKSVAII